METPKAHVLPEWRVADNPERPCPPEILARQVGLLVVHHGFDGKDHEGIIEVHQEVVEDVIAFFSLAYTLGFPIHKVVPSSHPNFLWDDNKLMAANTTSGFNFRTIAGTEKPSLHGEGLAFDVNTEPNPYIRYVADRQVVAPPGAIWNPAVPGTLFAAHPLVVLMKACGWEWGGDWNSDDGAIDYQHLQKKHRTVEKWGITI